MTGEDMGPPYVMGNLGSKWEHMKPNQWDFSEGRWGMKNIHKKNTCDGYHCLLYFLTFCASGNLKN